MKKLNFLLAIGFVFAVAVSAQAEDYVCHAKANPNRGFAAAFDVEISGAKVGSDIVLKSGAKSKTLGTVTEVLTLAANDPDFKPAFDAILGYIAEEDVSGVSEAILNQISSIQVLKDGNSELEVSVFRLFVQDKQVGGSIVIDGMGTSCF